MHWNGSRSYGDARCRVNRGVPWTVRTGVIGIVILATVICLSVRERARYRAEVRETEMCTEMETFVRVMQAGIITSPEPTKEESAAVELANSRIRGLLDSAIQMSACG